MISEYINIANILQSLQNIVKNIQNTSLFCFSLLITSWSICYAQSDFITIEASQDNTLYETDNPTPLSNGAGQQLFFGLTGVNAGNVLRRTVLSYDLTAIPTGTEILSAELRITVNMVPGSGQAIELTANLHRLTNNWGEGSSDAPGPEGGGTTATLNDATWIHTFFDPANPNLNLWADEGGDFLATPSASTTIDSNLGSFTFSSTQLLDDVIDMINNPNDNFGWIIIGDETTNNNARRIASRENSNMADHPVLVIQTPAEVFFVDGFEAIPN